MKQKSKNKSPSTYGREVTLRIAGSCAKALLEHMRQDPHREQMAFGLAHEARTADGTAFILCDAFLPSREDLAEQSSVSVAPTKAFQDMVYACAYQAGATIVEFHTHPGSSTPTFSSVDEFHSLQNAAYIVNKLKTTLLMIVGNNHFGTFDGVVYDANLQSFQPVDRIEVLGRPSKIWIVGESPTDKDDAGTNSDSPFQRQMIVPRWNQQNLKRQRIGIGGAGGTGSQLFQSLVGIGAGEEGWIAIADDQCIETSNLSRIPYANRHHVGTPKVSVAVQYAAQKDPSLPVFPYPCSGQESAVLKRFAGATVLFGCGDNEGLRKTLAELSTRYGIPYIDLGCDIQIDGDRLIAGGQVRVHLPGQNACPVCCGGYDPVQASLDLLDDATRAERATGGYVRGGSDGSETPSIASLNSMTAQIAVAQLLALVNGEEFGRWDYLHFDQLTGRSITASTKRREDCPLCGAGGVLGMGDRVETLPERVIAPSERVLGQEGEEE
jgi:molybdopterin/thiamine biosynthesis adenylyltransferase